MYEEFKNTRQHKAFRTRCLAVNPCERSEHARLLIKIASDTTPITTIANNAIEMVLRMAADGKWTRDWECHFAAILDEYYHRKDGKAMHKCQECGEPTDDMNSNPRTAKPNHLVCDTCAANAGWIRCEWCGCWIETAADVDDAMHKACAAEEREGSRR